MNEELTLHRGVSGEPHLVADRCAHRYTVLHFGWVKGEEVRSRYHGWKFDPTGQCAEIPAGVPGAPDPGEPPLHS